LAMRAMFDSFSAEVMGHCRGPPISTTSCQ